jgi:hypothetical protein
MLKRRMVLALGFAALAAAWGSAPGAANASLGVNSLSQNGILENGLMENALSNNGIADNGIYDNGMMPGVATKFATFQAVRLALPDGSELTFR